MSDDFPMSRSPLHAGTGTGSSVLPGTDAFQHLLFGLSHNMCGFTADCGSDLYGFDTFVKLESSLIV